MVFDSGNVNPLGSSVHEILQVRILEGMVPSSKGSSRLKDRTCLSYVSCFGSGILTTSATWEAQATCLVASNQELAERCPNSVLWTPKSAVRDRGPFQVNVRKRGAALHPLQPTNDHHSSAAPSGRERSPVSKGKTPGGHRNRV